jgi:hypothetical protein
MKKIKFLLITVLLIVMYNLSFAEFDTVSGGARPTGMGKAFTSIADDSNAVFYNPAGMLQLDKGRFESGYTRLLTGLTDNSDLNNRCISYVAPMANLGALGFGFHTFNLAGYYTESVWSLSYAKYLDDYIPAVFPNRLLAGVTIKQLSKRYDHDMYTLSDPLFAGKGYTKDGFAIDIGFLYKVMEYKHSISLVVSNFNQPSMNLDDSSTKLPLIIKLGIAYMLDTVNFDFEIEQKQRYINGYTGIEKWLARNTVAVRTGIGIGSNEYRMFSFGLTYKTKMCQVDYAYVYPMSGITNTGGNHTVSVGLPLQLVPEEILVSKVTKYIVKEGDTLPEIAALEEVYGDAKEWRKIYEANKDKISDSYELRPGDELVIPRVWPGDWLK